MNPSRILVVEDEAIVAMEIEERLTVMGYHVVGTASKGENAMELARDLRPELVLMDIRLQGAVDGIAAAEEILRQFRIPVIFLTAYSEEATLERAKLAEPYGYILKPFDDREIKSAIEIALYKHQAEEEIRCLNRLFDVLSQVNQSIARFDTREELLPNICRLVVERGAIDMAWIGWLDEDAARIYPVAHFLKQGFELDEDSPFAGPWSDHAETGESVRDGRPVICNECSRDSCIFPAEKRPVGMGFRSCGSFPFKFQGRVCGALNICVAKPGYFRTREIELLEEVAMDISFALDKIEGDAQREQAEARVRRQNAILEGINRILLEALGSRAEKSIGQICLSAAEEVTGSKFGFIAEIDEHGQLRNVAMSDPGWDVCGITDEAALRKLTSGMKTHGLYGKVIKDGKGFFTNNPGSHPHRVGLPPGHPPLHAFLGVPLMRGGEVVGLIALGNREGGYSNEEMEALESITPAMAEAFARRKTEEALALSRAEFEAMFNSISDASIFMDTQRRIVTVNPAFRAMFGYEPDQVRGRTTEFLYSGGAAYQELLQKSFNPGGTGVLSPLELSCVRGDGTKLLTETLGMQVRDASGNVIGLLETHRDITERKRVEEEKERLETQLAQTRKIEAVGRLAGGVAHDFNNMLGVILGHTELAQSGTEPDDPRYPHLHEIQKAALRSANLTRQLLAFARRQTIALKVLDLNETVEGMLKMLRRLIGEDIDLKWQPGANLWRVKVDPSQVDQVLANLCVNARDSITGIGKLTIETGNVAFDEAHCAEHSDFMSGEYVLLAVSDDGCGMDKETLNKVFEPFFTTKGVGKGTGLGLATVYGIVKQNNGFINVYSEPGMGTTFRIYLPRYTGKTDQPRKDSPAEPACSGQETVLLVEDEPSILNMTSMMLRRQGYTVLTACTPGEAIRLAEEYAGEIHLLMTDVIMPEMNGRELAKSILLYHPGVKRLFMSGYTANVIAHHGVLDAGVDFIQKPFSSRDLAAKIREALGPKDERGENEKDAAQGRE